MSKTSTDDLIDYFRERLFRLNIVRLANEMQQSQKIIEYTDPNFNESDIIKMVETLINNQKIIKAIK